MHLNRTALPLLALMLGALGPGSAWASGLPQQGPPPPGYGQGYGQDRNWEIPPQQWNDLQQKGFHDGIEGARRDFGNHRNPNVENREEYRDPDLPHEQREAYRDGFRRGYQVGVAHLYGQQQPVPDSQFGQYNQPGQYAQEMAPNEFSAVQRQGFQDGIEGAHRDFDNHRNPNVENRDEYRDPHLPYEQRDAYREGFRRGYMVGASRLWGPQVAPPPAPLAWDMAPDTFNDIQQNGFRDGMEGARRDADNHRNPNPNNRDEYRNPHVPYEMREAYREGFRRGYNRAMDHIMGHPWQY